jgi:hypothetical protein
MTRRSPDVRHLVAFCLHDAAYAEDMVFEPDVGPRPADTREIVIEVARVTPRGAAIVIRTEQRPEPPALPVWPGDDDD